MEEVRAYKDQLLAQRRDIISQKLIRAEEKRHLQLQLKVRRAHEEETKVGPSYSKWNLEGNLNISPHLPDVL